MSSTKKPNNVSFDRMSHLANGGEIDCPYCKEGKISMVNRAVFLCNKCKRGIVARVKLNAQM
mgnify:CR=1 FL=1